MTQLRIIVPGNPWEGRVNARHGARAVRAGTGWRGQIFTEKAYLQRQDEAICWTQSAVQRQGVRFLTGVVVVEMVFYSLTVCRRFGCPDSLPNPDVDGPEKCHLDALGLWVTRKGKRLPGGGAMSDDVQVQRLVLEKRLGEPRAVLTVRRLTDPGTTC